MFTKNVVVRPASRRYVTEDPSPRYVTEDPKELCPSCQSTMSSKATYVGQPKSSSGAGAAGYVKGFVTYMIMDDLELWK